VALRLCRHLASGSVQKAADVDRGQLVGRRLKDIAVVVHLHELATVGERAAGWRDWRRFEQFAEVFQDFSDRPGGLDEGDEPDVAAARWAQEGKLLLNPISMPRAASPWYRASPSMRPLVARGGLVPRRRLLPGDRAAYSTIRGEKPLEKKSQAFKNTISG
jgi:hypothetical protein